jgi:hypothetical protein
LAILEIAAEFLGQPRSKTIPSLEVAMFRRHVLRMPRVLSFSLDRGRVPSEGIPLAVALVVALSLVAGEATSAAQFDAGLFQDHLAVGEFVPALVIARSAGDRETSDSLFARVAAAQAQAGMRDAAIRTVGEISSDRVRTETLAQIRQEPLGGRGGGAQPDFDSLIDLIKSTVAPATWDDVGGPGAIAPFPSGVWVDPDGLLRSLSKADIDGRLEALRRASRPRAGGSDDARRASPLRMVSLTRLEKQVQLLAAAGRPPTEAMHVLAGLQRIEYVFIYPETGDLVLAGPAGDWRVGAEGRIVSAQANQPVVRLDDLVVVFRHMLRGPDARFGCLITPTKEGLASLKAFVEESNKTPLQPSQRAQWLEKLRAQLGEQDIEIYGLDPKTRVARVLVEADYRMKLVGLGLEESVPGLQDYLASIEIGPNDAPPPMGVLRWWFTLNYEAIVATADHRAFAVRGQGLQVLSENEHLTEQGQRVHTGKSDALNTKFARGFTQHFAALCEKYPVYAELRNVADLALVAALVRSADLPNRVGWHMTGLGDSQVFAVDLAPAPQRVASVANLRVVNKGLILAAVSGGVRIDPKPLIATEALKPDDGSTAKRRAATAPKQLPANAWWWDE